MGGSRHVTAVVVTSGATASSTSVAPKMGYPPRSRPSSTTRTATHGSLLLHYVDGEKRYILAPVGIKVGDMLESGPKADIRPGNALPLRNIPTGTIVHGVELRPGGGAKMGRSAGTSIQLMSKENKVALLRLPSGEMRQVNLDCRATVGQVGNKEAELIKIGKAGRNRWKGKRPQSRGVAMNPVDHPLGGGEGRSSGGRHPVSPWGKPERRTRKKNKASDKYIVRRRAKKGKR